MVNPNTAAELNRLYWESDASVSDIADRLDISRRALYDGIEPRPAGRPCPECGAPLGFRNRTARDNREAECPACGFAAELGGEDDRRSEPDRRSDDRRDESDRRSDTDGRDSERPVPRAFDPEDAVLGSAFLAGLGIGAVVTYLLQRR